MHTKFNTRLFDLEPRDLNVYETMLSMDQASSIRAIADSTRLNRGTTFEIIKRLLKRGLVASFYKNKRKYYAAEPPTELVKLTTEQHEQMSEELLAVEAYAKKLQDKVVETQSKQFTRFYDGEEEIAMLLRDVLDTVSKTKSKRYDVISSAEVRNHLYGKFRNFTKQRIRLGIFTRALAIGIGGDIAELSERRLLESDDIPACYIIIYGDKVAQISFSDNHDIQGVMVHNRGVFQLQKLLFEQAWDKAKTKQQAS